MSLYTKNPRRSGSQSESRTNVNTCGDEGAAGEHPWFTNGKPRWEWLHNLPKKHRKWYWWTRAVCLQRGQAGGLCLNPARIPDSQAVYGTTLTSLGCYEQQRLLTAVHIGQHFTVYTAPPPQPPPLSHALLSCSSLRVAGNFWRDAKRMFIVAPKVAVLTSGLQAVSLVTFTSTKIT